MIHIDTHDYIIPLWQMTFITADFFRKQRTRDNVFYTDVNESTSSRRLPWMLAN